MDRICNAVFNKILSLTPVGRYVIIAEDEFAEEIEGDTEGGLKRAIAELKKDGYIDVKYSRGDMYCLAPLKENIAEAETEEPEDEEIYEERKSRLNANFLYAFAGGALGSALISLIFALV